MRIALALAAVIFMGGCSGGQDEPNGTCSFEGQTFTQFIYCPGSTVCCPSYDNCAAIVGGGWSCVAK
jgi:hypothetical protein